MTPLAGRDGRRRRAGDLGRQASTRVFRMGESDRCGHLFFVFAGVMIVEEVRDGADLRDARSNGFHVCGSPRHSGGSERSLQPLVGTK